MGQFFFFKQKTAYDVRISDWSSDVCSSDLPGNGRPRAHSGQSGSGGSRVSRKRIDSASKCSSRPVSGSPTCNSSLSTSVASSIPITPGSTPSTPASLQLGAEIGRAHVELQSLMRISYAVFCLQKKKIQTTTTNT